MFVWNMNLEVAEEFWRLCIERHAETEPERIAILLELKDRMNAVYQTERTPDELKADMAKHYQVIHVGGKDGKPTN